MKKFKFQIHDCSIENSSNQYLDVEVNIEGYLTLKLETQEDFHINGHKELEELFDKLKELMPKKK